MSSADTQEMLLSCCGNQEAKEGTNPAIIYRQALLDIPWCESYSRQYSLEKTLLSWVSLCSATLSFWKRLLDLRLLPNTTFASQYCSSYCGQIIQLPLFRSHFPHSISQAPIVYGKWPLDSTCCRLERDCEGLKRSICSRHLQCWNAMQEGALTASHHWHI